MKMLARPKNHAVLGEIIRVCSFSTHTYSNNQEHSVLPAQKKTATTFCLAPEYSVVDRPCIFLRKLKKQLSCICLLRPFLTWTLSGVLPENTSTSLSIENLENLQKIWRYLINTCNILYNIVYIHRFS